MAAFEGIYTTEKGADLTLLGWVSEADKSVTGLKLPSGLSMMLHLDPDATVTGMDSVPVADTPPVQLTFQSYHLMIALSFVFILIMLVALALHLMKRLENARWMLWVLVCSFPLPIIAINMGWTATEVGRQPWIVQGLLRTSDGVSPVVSASEIWVTLGLFALVYLVLFIAWLRIFTGIIRKGPEDVAEMLEGDKAGPRPEQGAAKPAVAGTKG